MVLVGIIGGKGAMGIWLENFFRKNRCQVIVSDKKTKLTNSELASKCDVVIVSVPIDLSVKILTQIGPYVKRASLLMDVTSLKQKQVKAMLQHTKCEVLGTHPMFGPGVKSISGQTIILCPARGKRWFNWFKSLLIKNRANVKVATPQKNDEFMSVIQGLIHFSSISTAHAMMSLGFNLKESLSYTSPIYKIRLDMLGRILNQDPSLYSGIELQNPYVRKTLKQYLRSVKILHRIIKDKNKREFIDFFKKSSSYMGNFKKNAEKESDYMIEQLVKLG